MNSLERQTGITAPPAKKRAKSYNFEEFQLGDSTHVKTAEERRNILVAFKYWAKNTEKKSHRYVTSRKVDETDPSGPGYRIWFMSRKADAEAKSVASGSDDI